MRTATTADLGQTPVNGPQLTDAAAARVQALVREQQDPELKLRVYVQGGGCDAFQYGFTFEKAPNEGDLVIRHQGAVMLVDAQSAAYLVGARVDYQEALYGRQFIVDNPNTPSCGCA